jgi:hypothetical protein
MGFSCQDRPLMTPWTALLLGLAIVAVLAMHDAKPALFIIVGVGWLLAALIALWLGYGGARQDVGSSWSDEGPQRALKWAASLAAAGTTSLLAVVWPALWRWRERRRR